MQELQETEAIMNRLRNRPKRVKQPVPTKDIYEAKLGRNFRDVNTINPLVLLSCVTKNGKPFREGDSHCYVSIVNSGIEQYIPKRSNKPISIRFTAKEVPYRKGVTLSAIKVL